MIRSPTGEPMSRTKGTDLNVVTIAISLALVHCGEEETCGAEVCPTPSVSPEAQDYVVELDPASLVTVQSGDVESSSEIALRGGRVVFRTDDPACLPTPDAPCVYTVRAVELALGEFILSVSNGSQVSVRETTAFLSAPRDAEDTGTGATLPSGTSFDACMEVDGERQHATAPLASPLFIDIDPSTQSLGVDGTVEMTVRLPGNDCKESALSAHVMLTGVTPWEAVPTGADGG